MASWLTSVSRTVKLVRQIELSIWSKGKRFTVDFWANIFSWLLWRGVSRLFAWVLGVPSHPAEGYNLFAEVFPLATMIFSAVFFWLYSVFDIHWRTLSDIHWYGWIVVVLGISRYFEIFVKKIYELLFKPHIDEKLNRAKEEGQNINKEESKFEHETVGIHGAERFMVLTLYNYVEIVFWFALSYNNLAHLFNFTTNTDDMNPFFIYLHASFYTMTSFGYSLISPRNTWGGVLTLTQLVIGIFLTLLILARFISMLPPIQDLGESDKD